MSALCSKQICAKNQGKYCEVESGQLLVPQAWDDDKPCEYDLGLQIFLNGCFLRTEKG